MKGQAPRRDMWKGRHRAGIGGRAGTEDEWMVGRYLGGMGGRAGTEKEWVKGVVDMVGFIPSVVSCEL